MRGTATTTKKERKTKDKKAWKDSDLEERTTTMTSNRGYFPFNHSLASTHSAFKIGLLHRFNASKKAHSIIEISFCMLAKGLKKIDASLYL